MTLFLFRASYTPNKISIDKAINIFQDLLKVKNVNMFTDTNCLK